MIARRTNIRRAVSLLRSAVVGLVVLVWPDSLALSQSSTRDTFTNPVLDSGPDPWVFFKDGYYYYMNSTGRNLTVRKARSVPDLRNAERKVVWRPPASGPYSRDIWAPEIHFIEGKWYIYFAADEGSNPTHRMWVLENTSPDPLQGEWVMKGKLADATDRWAIDASVFELRGRLYTIWSGWEYETNGVQSIYIATMKNPWTIEGPRVRISSPLHPWERIGELTPNAATGDPAHVDVNEGPQILKRGDKLFLIYSASGCWTDSYCLGMLTADASSSLRDPASWKKSPQPVLSSRPEAKVFAPGHCSFFKSPDGKEDWILFHANPEPGQGCGRFRSPRTQRISWRADGTPDFGQPIPLGTPLRRPSGEAR